MALGRGTTGKPQRFPWAGNSHLHLRAFGGSAEQKGGNGQKGWEQIYSSREKQVT